MSQRAHPFGGYTHVHPGFLYAARHHRLRTDHTLGCQGYTSSDRGVRANEAPFANVCPANFFPRVVQVVGHYLRTDVDIVTDLAAARDNGVVAKRHFVANDVLATGEHSTIHITISPHHRVTAELYVRSQHATIADACALPDHTEVIHPYIVTDGDPIFDDTHVTHYNVASDTHVLPDNAMKAHGEADANF